MKLRLFILTLLIVALSMAGQAAAQVQQPPANVRPMTPAAGPVWDPAHEEGLPRAQRFASARTLDAASSPTVPIGQPGLSFRYTQTFGETGVPYFADTGHINYPWGVAAAGNAVWIGDMWGRRALKFTNDGSFVAAIGQVGVQNYGDYNIYDVADVALDSSGNTWLVHSNQVLKFDNSGAYVSTLGEGLFQYAASVAFDSAGNIYVSDGTLWWGGGNPGNHRIQIFDSSGTYLNTLGATGVAGTANNRFHGPRHIAIYANTLYVADSGNHRVQLFDVSNPMAPAYVATIGVTGQSGSDNGHLGSPSGVAVDANYIYVADTWHSRVQVFNRITRAYVATIGGTQGAGNSQFYEPSDVAVDAAGNIYVADFVNTRVQQFDSSRAFVRTYGTTGVPYLTDGYHYNSPSGVAAAADGSLYITEDGGHRLIKLDAAGQLAWTVGAAGVKGDWNNANDRLNNPADVALDAAGRVLVADRWNGRVQVFNADGTYYATISQAGPGNRGFNCPGGVGVALNGDIYVANTCSHVVDIFDRYWRYLATLGTVDEAGTDNAHFDEPEDVAVDSQGFIYVADKRNHRVQVFDVDRAYVRTIAVTGEYGSDFGHLGEPNGLAVDGADRLFVADQWNNRIQVFDASGAYLATIGGSWGNLAGRFKGPSGVAVAPNGAVAVTDWDNHRVQKFSLGLPGWKQVNVNGFGDHRASWISTVLPFRGSLYAAGYPARVWRMTPAGVWSQANEDGFGDETNGEIDALAEFDGYIYAATFTWVCDDPNCNTGHSNGPQVYRSVDGSTWQLAAPAGSFGSGYRYISTLTVFDGYLYAGVGSGDQGQGAEIWRTTDGLVWTRVMENGFDDDLYNTDILSLAVHGGQLYAGTRHGDWIDDGHPNGPLGGEVWRSSDGVHWTQANVPGFGTLEAHRVESLVVFQNGLYAYVSHVGGTAAGADVWRCTRSTCATQADWIKVVDNGFGVPANQYLYAGAAADGYLYGVARNDTTGPQIFRTADGVAWSKATPYDGLGDSTNVYVSNHAMTVFGDRLFLGVTNGAKGAGVWQKTVTADFSATPLTGRPPLAVSFSNASAGDFTSSLWDFGDGQTSTAANPTHTYTQAGAYTVRLTVSDGVDSHTLTRPGYVNAWYRTFLPIAAKGYDPTLYDGFNNGDYDGGYNPLLWSFEGDTTVQFRQQSGELVVTNSPSSDPPGTSLRMRHPWLLRWQQVQQFQARLKVSSDRSGGWSPIGVAVTADEVNGHTWYAECGLAGATHLSQASFGCYIFIRQGNSYLNEYETPGIAVNYDTWHTIRIELDPNTANVRFYLDNALIGSHTPSDAAALSTSEQVQIRIVVWGAEANSAATRYVDDVRITPAR